MITKAEEKNMIKPNTYKKGLIRGYVIYAESQAGCISMDAAKDENNIYVGIAYTLWHRHDDDPNIVMNELDRLQKCYSSFHDYAGGMLGYEYKPYSR